MSSNEINILQHDIHSQIKCSLVTSLKFMESCIFAGIAGDLHVYKLSETEIHNCERILSHNVFSSENIHGIRVNQRNILTFGGKKAAVVRISDDHFEAFVVELWDVEDWILDGVWNDECVILLTAHNVLLKYNYLPAVAIAGKVMCTERCILYSGTILGTTWEDITVIAGTVNQEILIWSNGGDKLLIKPVLHRLQGHQGVIFSIAYDEETRLLCSTSDDRSLRVWSVNFSEKESLSDQWTKAVINLSCTVFGHTARVWKSCFTPGGRIITIGEDSQIALWGVDGSPLGRWDHNGDIRCLDFFGDRLAIGGNGLVVRSMTPLPELKSYSLSNEFGTPKCAALNECGHIILTTDAGYLIVFNGDIIDYFQDERFVSYCVFSISPCRKYVILGGINGNIVVYKVNQNKLKRIVDEMDIGRIYALAWAGKNLIVSCGEEGRLILWKLLKSNGDFCLSHLKDCVLPISKERWITCALVTEDFLICGDRMGSVHSYLVLCDDMNPIDSLKKLHGTKGVSDLKRFDGVIYSIGREGTMKELSIKDSKLQVLSQLKLPMDWATEIIQTNNGLVITGFYGGNFLIWKVGDRITLLELECGGGHRSFDCSIEGITGQLILSYIRLKNVQYFSCSMDKLVHQTIVPGYHKKSINTACLLTVKGSVPYILSGGEDNTLRLTKLINSNWKNYSTYLRHISSVRTVSCTGNVLVSAGGRAQLVVWKLVSQNDELRLEEAKSHMIREESEHRRAWRDAVPLVDGEIRYMDLAVMKTNAEQYSIYTACSDGMLRSFKYNETSDDLELVNGIQSEHGCLLKLCAFKQPKGNQVVITGSTAGIVSFWYKPYESRPVMSHQLFQLGVNSMDILLKEGENSLILAAGCDDSSLAVIAFSLLDTDTECVIGRSNQYIHTAQVSGIKITKNYVVSAGVDQKLCLYSWTFNGEEVKTLLISQFMTSIPDIHGLLMWQTDMMDEFKILVFGDGFQVLHLDSSRVTSLKDC